MRLELQAVGAVIDPQARGGDRFPGGDCRGMADHGDEIAAAMRRHPQHAEAVLLVMERDPLDEAGQHLARGFGGGW